MKLEEFLEKNRNAKFDDEFNFDNLIIRTTHQFPLERDVITVIGFIPCLDWIFAQVFDLSMLDTTLGEKAGFYFWLKDKFNPKMKEALLKRLRKEEKEITNG